MTCNAKSIVGKTISGVITRPVGADRDGIVILQFSDGSCFEFVSPRARRWVSRMAAKPSVRAPGLDCNPVSQLSFFPQDGGGSNAATATAAAA